jgi:hypothetical protein
LKKLLILIVALGFVMPMSLAAAANKDNLGASQTIGDEEAEPKDPMMATVFSILPGLVFHGSGNMYAGNFQDGTRMLVMEIFGAGLSLWGHNIIHQPENWGPYFGDNVSQAGYWIKAAGVGLVTVSWVWDVATAPDAAMEWNKDNQLQLQMDTYDGSGARLQLLAKF